MVKLDSYVKQQNIKLKILGHDVHNAYCEWNNSFVCLNSSQYQVILNPKNQRGKKSINVFEFFIQRIYIAIRTRQARLATMTTRQKR